MSRLSLALLAVLAVAGPAWGGKKKPRVAAPTEQRADEHGEGGTPGLLDDPYPVDPGRLPRGLANFSAQGCAACHYAAYDAWASGAHAAPPSAAFRAAVAEAGTPACLTCHQPLLQQRAHLTTYDGSADNPVSTPNPAWNPTLGGEGVTCAACHLRRGKVLATQPPTDGPHPTVWSADLGRPATCAACHQGGWADADAPLYDTYGEWLRSAYPAAGIGCIDCHGHGAAGHAVVVRRGRAASVLVDLPSDDLARGAPIEGAIRVQNTGAGHAFPTGTPWRSVRLRAALVGPDGRSVPVAIEDFARTIQPIRPYAVIGDTRIPAGGERRVPVQLLLPADATAGAWELVVELLPMLRGEPDGDAFFVRRIPLVAR